MKRFIPAILTLAIVVGVFAPAAASFSPGSGIAVRPQIAYAQTTTDSAPDEVETGNDDDKGTQFIKDHLDCGVGFFGEFSNCLVWIFYFIPYTVGGWLMWLSAWVFDKLAGMTLSSEFYSGASFISDGWRLVRDFSNIFFILILLFIALSLVLNIEIGHANPKEMLGSVIIIAIFINFSFFVTEVIIDLSNSLALVFYNQIAAEHDTPSGKDDDRKHEISVALVRAWNPAIMQSDVFWKQVSSEQQTTAAGTSGATEDSYEINPVVTIGVLIMIGLMYLFVAYSFFVASMSFIGRLISLWVAIIFAPFAFVTYIIPSARHWEGFGWSTWWKKLFEAAFAAPIFFFFMLLIYLMTKTPIVTVEYMEKHGAYAALVLTIIAMAILIYLLIMATKYVKKGSGEFAAAITKFGLGAAALAGGAVLGAAAGGGSFLARNSIGKLGRGMSEDPERKKLAAGMITDSYKQRNAWTRGMSNDQILTDRRFRKDQRWAERGVKLGRGIATSSFDWRHTAAGNMLAEKTGMDMGGFGILSADRSAGGLMGARAHKAEKIKKFKDSLGFSHDEQVALEDTMEGREAEMRVLEGQQKAARAGGDTDQAERLQLQINQLREGTLGIAYTAAEVASDTTGTLTKSDIGKLKHMYRNNPHPTAGNLHYTADDITNGTIKANGKAVTQSDVDNFVIRDQHLGIDALKKLVENNQKAMGNAYVHYKMVNSGYAVDGMRQDALGNVKQLGHYHGVGTSRKDMARDFGRALATSVGSAAVSGAIGTALAGPLGTIAGATAGFIRQWRREMRQRDDHNAFMIVGTAAGAAADAGDSHYHAPHYSGTYKAPASGLFSLFRDAFKAAGGGDHGGGGHGGHDSGHGGGDHGGGHGGGHH